MKQKFLVKKICLRMKNDMYKEIAKLAKTHHMAFSSFVRMAISEKIQKQTDGAPK